MADLPLTSDDGATPVIITGVASPNTTAKVNTDGSLPVEGLSASGSAVAPNPVIVGGIDPSGTTIRTVTTDMALGYNALATMDSPIITNLIPENKVYCAGFDVSAATANTDNPIVFLRNPTGSGVSIFLWRLTSGTTVTNVSCEFEMYPDPTVSANGTTITPQSRYVGGGAGAAKGLLTTIPTATSVPAVALGSVVVGQNSNSYDLAEAYGVLIAPGHSILLTANPSSNNRNCSISIVWIEF